MSAPPKLVPLTLLAVILVVAVDAMWLQPVRTGAGAALHPLPTHLPGSSAPVLRRYTGVAAVDDALALLNVLWVPVVDGSNPPLTTLAAYFGGQLTSFVVVLLVEGAREGASWWMSPLFWGLLMQASGFGIAMPLFAMLNLLLPASAVRVRDPIRLHAVVPALVLGYGLPSALMAYPFAASPTRQRCVVLWQPFIVYVAALQRLATGLLKRTSTGHDAFASPVQRSRRALNYAYGVAWNVSVAAQFSLYAAVFFIWRRHLTLWDVFVPRWHPQVGGESVGEGMLEFLRYDLYCGAAAALVWAVALMGRVRLERTREVVRGVMVSLLLAGPGGAVVAVLQQRDELVLADEAKAEKRL